MTITNSAIGYDFTTSSYNQIEVIIGNYAPLKVWQDYGTGGAITGTASFNGGTQTLVLKASSPATNIGDVVYVSCNGDLSGYFTIVNTDPTGFVIDKAFTTNQTGSWSRQSLFKVDESISQNMVMTMRAVGASELVIPSIGTQESFTNIVDSGSPSNHSIISGTTNTGSIVGVGRMIKISGSTSHDGVYDVLSTPTGTSFEINRAFTTDDSGNWESAIYTPVITYTGTSTINVWIQVQLAINEDYRFAVMVNKDGGGFEVLDNSISNNVSTDSPNRHHIFGASDITNGDEILMCIIPDNTPRSLRNIRFGAFGITSEGGGSVAGLPFYQITLVNGANQLLPGGTTFDGGNVPFKNVADPVLDLDVTNKQWVESRIPFIGNYVYVKTEDDFGSISSLSEGDAHVISQNTIFILSQEIALINATLGVVDPNINFSIVGIGKNYSDIVTLDIQLSQPLIQIEDMQNVQFSLENIRVKETSANAYLLEIHTNANVGIYNDIYISNCIFENLTSIAGNIMFIDYNAAPGKFYLNNCLFNMPSIGCFLGDIPDILIKDNIIFRPSGGSPISFFTLINNLESRGVIENNRFITLSLDNFIFLDTPSINDDVIYTINNNDVRVANYFNPIGINETDARVRFYANYDKSSKYWEEVMYAISVTSVIPNVINTPFLVDFGVDQGTTTDPVSLASNIFTFNEAGYYYLVPRFTFGRTGSSGVEQCAIQLFLNGNPVPYQMYPVSSNNIDDFTSDQLETRMYFNAGDTLYIEMANISSGGTPSLDMGLISKQINTIASWIPSTFTDAISPSAEMIIYRYI